MHGALRAFVAEPSLENYLTAREELLAVSSRSLTVAELDALPLLADANDIRGLTEAISHLPSIAALVPRVHYYAALAAEARGDQEDLELEQMLLVICLRAMLLSGDGSEEAPYIICAPSDALDLLQELELAAESRTLVNRGDAAFDVIRCDDGSDVWFDASAMVQIPAKVPAISPSRREKTGKSRRRKARRPLTRTGR